MTTHKLTVGMVLYDQLTTLNTCQGNIRLFFRETKVEVINQNENGLRKLVKVEGTPPYFGWVGNELLEEIPEQQATTAPA
jgi:hypothetical protein